jgi:hypothetical protein
MLRSILFLFISSSVFAQPDSVRYDKWIGWITPTTLINLYHPAIDIGVEYNPGKKTAFIVNSGLDIAPRAMKAYHNQHHRYLKLGVKQYTSKKPSSGYAMAELGLFHLRHYGKEVSLITNDPRDYQPANARFHEFLLKPGVIVGGKIKIGKNARMDIFTGLGIRMGIRKHKLVDELNFSQRAYSSFHGMIDPADRIVLADAEGWNSVKRRTYFTLGIRFGRSFSSGFKTVE